MLEYVLIALAVVARILRWNYALALPSLYLTINTCMQGSLFQPTTLKSPLHRSGYRWYTQSIWPSSLRVDSGLATVLKGGRIEGGD
jgi:hypothetical protein